MTDPMARPTTLAGPSAAAPPSRPGVIDLRAHQIDLQQHEPPGDPVCSARRCRAHAVWALRWNNPRLHTPERRKTWVACEEHREHLAEFLRLRGFLRDTVPLEDLAAARSGAAV